MTPDPIEQLLHEADETQGAAGAADPRKLAQRVIETSLRRQLARRVAGLVAMLALIVGAGWFAINRQRPIEIVRDVPIVAAPGELASLRRQIAEQESLVRRLLDDERRARGESKVARVGVRLENEPSERAAAVVVDQADRLYKSSGQSGPVLKAYEQVIQMFPNTFSADVARERAAALRKEG